MNFFMDYFNQPHRVDHKNVDPCPTTGYAALAAAISITTTTTATAAAAAAAAAAATAATAAAAATATTIISSGTTGSTRVGAQLPIGERPPHRLD